MNRSLLDTDILSELLKRKNRKVAVKAAIYCVAWGKLTVSTLAVLEISKGFHKRRLENHLNKFLSSLPAMHLLTLDEVSATLAGRIFADLERAGRPIGRIDPMVAAIAIRHGMTLATGNTVHYQRVIDCGYELRLDNWKD